MKFHPLDRYYTGVSVPVAALRSGRKTGVGEFADLPLLADWCAACGLSVIQMLPVNDTGGFASPYSALSALALHPLYLRISDLPECTPDLAAEAAALGGRFDSGTRVDYAGVLEGKLELLARIYSAAGGDRDAIPGFDAWVGDNPWVREYAVFRTLRDRYDRVAWREWPQHRDPTGEEILQLWDELPDAGFYAWLQYRLEGQLKDAADACRKKGVALKGDLPILMEEDSTDVWAHRDIFRTELRAGAPPDFFSALGQNWGFPAYDWARIEKNRFSWWRARLTQADKFYQAFRIDHVLGFFRLWVIPARNSSGLIGYFEPGERISVDELAALGFPEHRVVWLAEPHVHGQALRDHFGDRSDQIIRTFFARIGDEDLYRFAEDIEGERDIEERIEDGRDRGYLLDLYRDRALVRVQGEVYAPAWNFRECSRYRQISDEEKATFEHLVARKAERSEELWAEQGRRLLSGLTGAVSMLACAEDLGVIPRGVPKTLEDLGILGLRVPRWAKEYDKPGEPYIDPRDYPYSTVCAPSVHDTSTIREWWLTSPEEREQFGRVLGLAGEISGDYDVPTARAVMTALGRTGSALLMYQLQDFLAFDPELLAENPEDERINVPGTYNDRNWTYRMPVDLEALSANEKLRAEVMAQSRVRSEMRPGT